MILKQVGHYFLILYIFLEISVSVANDYHLYNLSPHNIIFQRDILKRSPGRQSLFKRAITNSSTVPETSFVVPDISNKTAEIISESADVTSTTSDVTNTSISNTNVTLEDSSTASNSTLDSTTVLEEESVNGTTNGTLVDTDGTVNGTESTAVNPDDDNAASGGKEDGTSATIDGNDMWEDDCLTSENCTTDDHMYYNVTYVDSPALWVEINPESGGLNGSAKHLNASNNFRYGYSMPLKMDFLYYGMPLQNVTITTGGFIYTGTVRHPKLTVTQYIAPFMGEFNPGASNHSNVFLYSDEKMFILQWDNITLNLNNNSATVDSSFTFQVQLHADNSIVFAYKTLPVKSLNETDHSNNVGVSDAYYMFSITNIYVKEYNQIKLKKEKLGSGTGVRLSPLPTCSTLKDCYNCSTAEIGFPCMWCEALQMCSDNGKDRQKSEWIKNKCNIKPVSKDSNEKCKGFCYKPATVDPNTKYSSAEPVYPLNSSLEITCNSSDYSLPDKVQVTANDVYTCTTGGSTLPVCQKVCTYTQDPQHGQLMGTTVGKTLKPGSTWNVNCKAGHSIKNLANRIVVCTDDGILEPDPKNIKCERYCTLPFLHQADYTPERVNEKYMLHEGDNVTVTCDKNHVLPAGAPSVITCTESFDNSTVLDCVGQCTLPKAPNNTFYSSNTALVGQVVNVTCSPEWVSAAKIFNCTTPGKVKKPPVCVNRHQQTDKVVPKSHKHVFSILLVLFLLTLVSVVGGWVFYAYRNPTTPSGLFLIEKCRPWTWSSNSYRRQPTNLAESYYMDGDI